MNTEIIKRTQLFSKVSHFSILVAYIMEYSVLFSCV